MPDTFPLYKAADFNTYTLASATGTSTGTQTWTLVEAFASNFPSEFPIIAGVFDALDTNFSASKEFVIISGNSAPSRQVTVSTRAVGPTSVVNHPEGSRLRILMTAVAWNNLIDELRTVRTLAESKLTESVYNTLLSQGNVPLTAQVTTGEAYTATRTDPNGGGVGIPVTGPTLLNHGTTGAVKADTSSVSLGALEGLCVAAEESGASGQTKRVYLPGSIVSGFTGLVEGTIYFPSAAVTGAWSITVPAYWRLAGRALSSTQMLITEGRTSANLQTAGTTGTTTANPGTGTRAARQDHEHKVFLQWTPIIQAPTSGSTSFRYVNKTGLTLEVVGFYAEIVGTVGTTATTVLLQKASQASVDSGSPSWSTVTSPNLTIDANEWTSNTAATPVGLSGVTLADGERLQVQIPTAGTGLGDVQFFVVMKMKNTY